MATKKSYQDFDVPLGEHLIGSVITRYRGMFLKMGDLETSYLADAIESIRVERPVYVAGLARSGSTILLEILAAAPGMATHYYRDFPAVYTPVWWNRLLDRVPRKAAAPVQRSHRDGILVVPDSPEAIEEVLWMAFFPDLHNPDRVNVLDQATKNARFERFYDEHLRKLLYLRNGRRYLSKANYNISRLEYLLKLYPDARFVLPVRSPKSHIASMMKQHALFCGGQRENSRGREYLRRVGHFEFGLERQPINLGDAEAASSVIALWNEGEEVRGWARYWAQIHRYAASRLDSNADLKAATLVVRFEDLCAKARETLFRLAAHCEIKDRDAFASAHAGRLRQPTYYRAEFSPEEDAAIRVETEAVAARFGY